MRGDLKIGAENLATFRKPIATLAIRIRKKKG
jgi:hypothetical protein